LPWRLKSKDFVNMLQYLVPEFHNLPSPKLFPMARTGFGEEHQAQNYAPQAQIIQVVDSEGFSLC
jgi:hypothetical protein